MTSDQIEPPDCPDCYGRPRGECPNCGTRGPGIEPLSDSLVEYERLAPFCWRARKVIRPGAWVVGPPGWCRRVARRNLARMLGVAYV